MEQAGITIIGAGVVGLAIAEALSAGTQKEIVVLERHDKFGQETSSRNSEVIHAGIYYPKESLKSRLCLQGNKMLYELCGREGIKHKKCGKIIVSTNEEEAKQIESIYSNAARIGVPGLTLLTKKEVSALEPSVFALNGIFSGSTGIIDSHGLMDHLFREAQTNGVMFAFGSEVTGLKKTSEAGDGKGYIVKTSKGEEILSQYVINCAGLDSDKIAEKMGIDINKQGYKLHYCKGDYFSVSGSKDKLNYLIYPVPHEKGHGLGVHATLDLDGFIRLGPDTAYVNEVSYDVDPTKRGSFYKSALKYLPWLSEAMLMPDTAGMRPKLQGPEDGFRDFIIKEETDLGLPGLINLIGIESPGLTACLAIAKHVSFML